MKTVILRLPDDIHDALSNRAGSINANVCKLLAESLHIDYVPPKRGGRRIPRNLTAAEIATAQVIPEQAPITPEKRIRPQSTLQPDLYQPDKLLAETGVHYAQIKPGGRFTGKVSSKESVPKIAGQIHPQWIYVGDLTQAEFRKRTKD